MAWAQGGDEDNGRRHENGPSPEKARGGRGSSGPNGIGMTWPALAGRGYGTTEGPMASTEAAAKAVAPPAKTRAMPSARTITWLTMCFMTVSAVASIRNTPSMAVYGLACIFLYLLPAVVFLLPTSLVAAELASGWDGGVYNWVSQGIGPKAGFIAIWTQFAMTLTYYPSLLAYVASTLAYVIYGRWPTTASTRPR